MQPEQLSLSLPFSILSRTSKLWHELVYTAFLEHDISRDQIPLLEAAIEVQGSRDGWEAFKQRLEAERSSFAPAHDWEQRVVRLMEIGYWVVTLERLRDTGGLDLLKDQKGPGFVYGLLSDVYVDVVTASDDWNESPNKAAWLNRVRFGNRTGADSIVIVEPVNHIRN